MFNKNIFKGISVFIGLIIVLMTTQCAEKTATATALPKDILGVSVGMNKTDAQKRLEEIAQFVSEDRKAGQLWQLKNDPYFATIAVAYDKEQKIRFVTAMVDKDTAKKRLHFTEIGDLSKAKTEIVEPHYRYIWEDVSSKQPAQTVIVYGDNADLVTFFSLSKKLEAPVAGEEEED